MTDYVSSQPSDPVLDHSMVEFFGPDGFFGVDYGIAGVVSLLRALGIDTFSSCQGNGPGQTSHCFNLPTVRFYASIMAAHQAVLALEAAGYCVYTLTHFRNHPPGVYAKHFGTGVHSADVRHWGVREDKHGKPDHFWEVVICPSRGFPAVGVP